jgi:hypothetical protein
VHIHKTLIFTTGFFSAAKKSGKAELVKFQKKCATKVSSFFRCLLASMYYQAFDEKDVTFMLWKIAFSYKPDFMKLVIDDSSLYFAYDLYLQCMQISQN